MAMNVSRGYQFHTLSHGSQRGILGVLNLNMIRLKNEQIECEQEANESMIGSQQRSQRKN